MFKNKQYTFNAVAQWNEKEYMRGWGPRQGKSPERGEEPGERVGDDEKKIESCLVFGPIYGSESCSRVPKAEIGRGGR